ncbi:MAG: hypothetical protein O3C34_15615, partial [Proteobacteria bacterium]|nr:hypothetical protein [Pseudomonadota bacterium]
TNLPHHAMVEFGADKPVRQAARVEYFVIAGGLVSNILIGLVFAAKVFPEHRSFLNKMSDYLHRDLDGK